MGKWGKWREKGKLPVTTEKDPQQGREAAAPSNIREIQEIQGGQEAPHNADASDHREILSLDIQSGHTFAGPLILRTWDMG
jgi:hypothetical protein